MARETFDCVVIGSGPGGYVSAIRAAQRGLKTALVEAGDLGGTCLNRGCIPSKTLIAGAEVLKKVQQASAFGIQTGSVSFDYSQMKQRKDGVVSKIRKGLEGLIKSNQITIVKGFARFISPYEVAVTEQDEVILQAQHFIVATGSEPRLLPLIPCDGKIVHDSTSLLNLEKLPKKLIIVGGGVIGCEFACLHQALGVDVTIVEIMPNIIPTESQGVSETLTKIFKKRGIHIHTSAKIAKFSKTEDQATILLEDGTELNGDCVLVSVGRKFNTDNVGLEKAGVIVAGNGTIPTDHRMRTNIPHIYAIGDITGRWILAHVASHQGLIAADNASGLNRFMHYEAVPSVIYTDPEIATIGYSLEQAQEKGFDAVVGAFPFQALGKSQASMDTEGFAQIIADKQTGQILGAQVVGYQAATLIAEIAVAMNSELTVHSITDTIHAHPTLAEAWLEAALLTDELPLHMPPRKKVSV